LPHFIFPHHRVLISRFNIIPADGDQGPIIGPADD
jgi:hypothetical protein